MLLYPNNIFLTHQGAILKPFANTFQNGMLTVNFSNNYHLDMKDCNFPTHISVSPPSSWDGIASESPKSVFGLGSVVVDLSSPPQRVSFLPNQVMHCTSKPSHVPPVPSFLSGKCCSKTVLDKRREFYSFVADSIVAFGSFGHTTGYASEMASTPGGCRTATRRNKKLKRMALSNK